MAIAAYEGIGDQLRLELGLVAVSTKDRKSSRYFRSLFHARPLTHVYMRIQFDTNVKLNITTNYYTTAHNISVTFAETHAARHMIGDGADRRCISTTS